MRALHTKALIIGGVALVLTAACGPAFPPAFTTERLNFLPDEMRNTLIACASTVDCQSAASNVRGAEPNTGQCSGGYCLFSRAKVSRCYDGEIKDCRNGDPGWCGQSVSQCTYASGTPKWQRCFSRNNCGGEPTPGPGSAPCVDPPRGVAREIPSSACMDLSVRTSKGVPFPSTKRIGLNVVITKRDNKAIVQRSEVEADVAQANQVFAPDVEFYIASFEENDTINPVAVTDSIANERIFDAKPTLPLLYVVSYVKGGGGALPSGNGTFVTLDRAHALVAHELAHALGLSHTYNIDDFVADTGFAPASCTYTSECRNPSTCNNCRYASCPEASTNPSPDPQNIMAWAVATTCNLKMTPGQRELVRCTLRTSQERLIAPAPCSCKTGFSCVDGNCVCKRTLCGNECVSLGTDRNCTKCGDVCLNDTRCQGKPKACVNPPLCAEGTRDCGVDCNGNQVCIPNNKPGGCPNFPCN